MSHSATQEISRLLWNSNTHYHVRESLGLDHTLSQENSFHNRSSYFIKVHFNAILPSVLRSSMRSLPFRFSVQNVVHISNLFHMLHALPIFSRLMSSSWWRSVKSTTYDAPHYATFCRLFSHHLLRSKYSPHHLILQHPFLCSSLNVRDQDSHQ